VPARGQSLHGCDFNGLRMSVRDWFTMRGKRWQGRTGDRQAAECGRAMDETCHSYARICPEAIHQPGCAAARDWRAAIASSGEA